MDNNKLIEIMNRLAPTISKEVIDQLISILEHRSNGNLTDDETSRQIEAISGIDFVLGTLARQRFTDGSNIVRFGGGSQFGDITIRDIVAGDLTTVAVTIHMPAQQTQSIRGTPKHNYTIQDLMELVNQYKDIRKKYKNGPMRDVLMEDVYEEMKDAVLQVTDLDILVLLESTDSGQKLLAYAYCFGHPNSKYTENLVNSLIHEKQPFVQHRGIKALGRLISLGSAHPTNTSLCSQLNSILDGIKQGTQRHAELKYIVKHFCQ